MKIKILILLLFVAPLFFISCSRDEPFIAPPPPPPAITPTINEIYSQGDSLNADWIEIYNSSSSQMDLSGYKIYNIDGQNGSKPKKVLASGTMLPAKGFLVIVVNDTTATGFDLSESGEGIWFENAAGTVIDNVTFPALGKDTSYARNPNGTNNWVKLSPPTKDASNGLFPVLMNEIYSRGVSGNLDWIEIYNPNSEAVDLTGYKIYDVGGNIGGSKPKKSFPIGSTIPAGGFYVIITDTADFAGDQSGFGLSSGGEEVWLENSNGTVIDNVYFLAMATNQTYGRLPDGTTNWQLLNTITRGAPNQP